MLSLSAKKNPCYRHFMFVHFMFVHMYSVSLLEGNNFMHLTFSPFLVNFTLFFLRLLDSGGGRRWSLNHKHGKSLLCTLCMYKIF